MRGIVVAVLVFVCAVAVTSTQTWAEGDSPGLQAARTQVPLQNLQVLPKDIERQQLTTMMRGFTASLGVECSHCHAGTNRERFKDDKPAKAVARKMLAMTMTINNDLLTDVGEPAAEGAMKVTCFTCHRGSLKPLASAAAGGQYHQ